MLNQGAAYTVLASSIIYSSATPPSACVNRFLFGRSDHLWMAESLVSIQSMKRRADMFDHRLRNGARKVGELPDIPGSNNLNSRSGLVGSVATSLARRAPRAPGRFSIMSLPGARVFRFAPCP